MSEQIKTVQLRDINGEAISPYTPASTVYYIYEEDGEKKLVNMETLLGSVDVDEIIGLQEDAVENIIELSGTSVQKIIDERDSYQADINSLSATVQTLYDKQFPLTISRTISGNVSTFACSYSYNIIVNGATIPSGSAVITHRRNDDSVVQVYSGSSVKQTLNNANTAIGFGRDVFSITGTTADGKSKTETDTRYIFLYGSSGEDMSVSDLKNTSIMSRIFNSGFSSANVTTTNQKKYIWLAVPKYLRITKVTSQGIDVSLVQRGPYDLDGCDYTAYRSQEPLNATDWSLLITIASA